MKYKYLCDDQRLYKYSIGGNTNYLYSIPKNISSYFFNILPSRSIILTAELMVKGGDHCVL